MKPGEDYGICPSSDRRGCLVPMKYRDLTGNDWMALYNEMSNINGLLSLFTN